MEAARGLEQAQQHPAEGNVLQRPVEHRLAHGADGVLELVHARVGRHPARFQVRLRHALVIALEEGEKILRQVVLVDVGERAHDAEIDGDVLAARVGVGGDEDIARMHVGVEKAVAEHLGEEDLHPGAGEARDVHAGRAQLAPHG